MKGETLIQPIHRISIQFKPLEINLNRLTNGKEATKIRFSVYSVVDEEQEERILYGHCETSIKEIRADALRERDLIDEEANKGMKEAGTIKMTEFTQIEASSFVEYLKGGWFINMTVAIDFTASNKNHHKIVPGALNDYEIAIQQVGKILVPYAKNNKFFGYGFGGIPHYHSKCKGEVMHCFTLNGDGKAKIKGVDALLEEYRNAA